jgi:hypothetical protein
MFTTDAAEFTVSLSGATTPIDQIGSIRVPVFKNDKAWAMSIGFDDNVFFEVNAMPMLTGWGWQGTIYLIGNKVDPARDEGWIFDAPDFEYWHNQGWAIGGHGMNHVRPSSQQNAIDEIIQVYDLLRGYFDDFAADHRILSFAAPMTNPDYHPAFEEIWQNGPECEMILNEGHAGGLWRMDEGGVEPKFGKASVFELGCQLGRIGDWDADDRIAFIDSAGSETNHYWMILLEHGVDNHPDGYFWTLMENMHNTYGPDGLDNIWVAPAEVIYSYTLLRRTSTVQGDHSTGLHSPHRQAPRAPTPASVAVYTLDGRLAAVGNTRAPARAGLPSGTYVVEATRGPMRARSLVHLGDR